MSGIRIPRLLPIALGALLAAGIASAQAKIAIINSQQALVDTAHQTCPYSKALHGNIHVETRLI